ncbi:DUF924 family protein [Croceicoccus bisphenolivorans]|uniref:DUF924 family protein n=1 Tax=Croceicoccus bisphenolivorans TaxID=1783232 RepID=UPI00082F3C39|nr:DUF924 family protein [Croceicoccus bisphenolivorans]
MGDERGPWLPVLDYWFREKTPDQWFEGGEAVDREVRVRFSAQVSKALAGTLDEWAATPRGRLALIVLIDQFTRNIFRDDPRAYSGDAKAQAMVLDGLEKGMDKALTLSERQFFYLPLMHAEDAALQDISVTCFEKLAADADYVLDFARGHRNVVARFGHFPMRNKALGRATGEAEQAYLDAGGGYPVDGERLG